MNILILCNNFLKGHKEATKITITEFAELLERAGHQVEVIPDASVKSTLKKVKKLKKAGKSFDIIHGFSAAPLLAMKVRLAKRHFPNARTIQTLKSYSKKFLGSLSFSLFLNSVDKVTVSTNEFKEKLIMRGCPENKISVIRSPINLSRFIPLKKEELKEAYNFKDKNIIFYYGSLHHTKGSTELIKSAAPILQKDKDTILLMCPRHNPQQEILDLITELGIWDQTHIVTEDVNIVEYLNMGDVLLLPYTSMVGTEGNPSCLLEAAACKVPVVTSNFAELREVMTPDEDVLMANPGNVQKFEENIRKLLVDEELRNRLTENAFRKKEQFDHKTITKQFLELYRD
jgi:glycosyltransferase involved in cell wall biosynthesis